MSNCSFCGSEWAHLSLSSVECVNPSCEAYDHKHAHQSFAAYFRKRVLSLLEDGHLDPIELPLNWQFQFKVDTIVCWAPIDSRRNQIFTINF